MLARAHHRIELADCLTPVLLTRGSSNTQGTQPHEVRDPKALWEIPPFVDLAQTKKPPVHLNGLLAAHIFHPARCNPAPRTDGIPIEFYCVFCVSHVCYSSAVSYVASPYVYMVALYLTIKGRKK